jgi:hypothetical protein
MQYEAVFHSAQMRLPPAMSTTEKRRVVDRVLEALQISDKRDVECGDMGGRSTLSGGQRKRVSVALELAMLPAVIALDEPTSGLDAETAFNLMRVLKNDIAKALNIAVIIVLHQPRAEIMHDCIDQVGVCVLSHSLACFGLHVFSYTHALVVFIRTPCLQVVMLSRGEIRYRGATDRASVKTALPVVNEPRFAHCNIGEFICGVFACLSPLWIRDLSMLRATLL